MKRIWVCMLLSISIVVMVIGCTTADMSNLKTRQAVNALKRGDVEQYKILLREAYTANPNNPYVISNLAAEYEMGKNIPEAKAQYRECIAKAGDAKIAIGGLPGMEGMLLKDVCADNLRRLDFVKQ
ncbi:MAG: hypothetical protein PHN75_05890 [Syntrophales bacterium]|nr:hypothetical protein [Syntrophales bacterium]